MLGKFRDEAFFWFAVLALTLGGVVACGDTASELASTSSAPTTSKPVEDLVMTDSDFVNIHAMTPVNGRFIDNRLGHLEEALAVARSETGGIYPVGTIIQLVPQEAIVKRKAGWSPRTNDWEFFFLDVTETGTKIAMRGTVDTKNRFDMYCVSCHREAEAEFDFTCGGDHGCALLPVGEEIIRATQDADPRPMP